MAYNNDKYARQIVLPGMGEDAQKKLSESVAVVFGLGALGSVIAERLCRAGTGKLVLADRDAVELSNLQRQALYTEEDARSQTPKAVACAAHLAKINSDVETIPIVADITSSNIESIAAGADIVLDGSDNYELRALICEVCDKYAIPWVYGGALGAAGATMNVFPGDGPCFRCIAPDIPAPGSYPTCATAGVLGMTTSVVASVQAAEAIKILIGSKDASRRYLAIDLWNNAFDYVEIERDPECPVCGKKNYSMLSAVQEDDAVVPLCTPGSFQVTPAAKGEIDLGAFAERLSPIGLVMHNPYLLRFDSGDISFNLFNDGRAVIRGARDEAAARSIYSEYVGL